MPTSTFDHLNSDKKQRILDALNQEFSAYSLQSAQVARIIKTAAIPRGSFYKYFADLQDAYNYLYQTAVEFIHDPFQQLDFHDSNQLTQFTQLTEQYIAQMRACPYYGFFKMHFTQNESTLASVRPLSHQPITDPVLWAIATLSHATVKEIMLDEERQTMAIQRLQTAIQYYTKGEA